ncbi:MAG: hypothetical protein RI909_2377, partial [Bacteroidota bacterium]
MKEALLNYCTVLGSSRAGNCKTHHNFSGFQILGFILPLMLISVFSTAQTVKLEQGQNGGVEKTPISPVNWATGNTNNGNSHYLEGQSIPYRLTISKLSAGTHTVEFEWDIRNSGKSAIDYITGFQRICETVDPLKGLSGSFIAGSPFAIPAPTNNVTLNGISQPATSFGSLSNSEKAIVPYNATITSAVYTLQGDPSAANASSRIRITFTIARNNSTALFVWGGHIASTSDWQNGNSATNINGSPYHMRMVSLDGKSVGSQDRSCQVDATAVDDHEDCILTGNTDVCLGSSVLYTSTAGGTSYAWTVTGGTYVAGPTSNSILVTWNSGTKGKVEVTINHGLCTPKSCSIDVNLSAPTTLTVNNATLCSTEIGGTTAVLNLNDYVVATGGSVSFSIQGVSITNPETYLATNQDVITASIGDGGSCSSAPKSFTITVTDRKTFGVCAPISGKIYEVIGSELTMLKQIYDPQNPIKTNEVFFLNDHKVLVEIIFYTGQLNTLLPILQGAGMGLELDPDISDFDGDQIIAGFFPIANLDKLNQVNAQQGVNLIQFVRPAFPPVGNVGDATTQGDKVMRSDLVRIGYFNEETNYQLSGSNIKVGVLSDSYNTLPLSPATTDVGNWDLPGAANHPFGVLAPVQVLKDFPSKYGAGKDEGRAMLQIIHDIAPRAALAFRTGFLTAGDFAQGIRDLKDAQCDIIVDDITYITEPFFTDGKVAKTVDEVSLAGVSYFTSAGNFGNKSFEGVFKAVDDPSIVLPRNGGTLSGRVHDFSGGDTDQKLTVYPSKNGPAIYTIALQWNDPLYSIGQTGTQYDLDIYLKNFQGSPLYGFNRDNSGGDPVEILTFSVSSKTDINLVIARECSTCTESDFLSTNIKFKYVIFRGELSLADANEYFTGSSTIVGQANAAGAMSVGAILYSNTPEYNFAAQQLDPTIQPLTVATFSSVGGMITDGANRNKPDFTAPNGVNTTVDFGAPNIENEPQPNFFGTSAAAPHAAGVAALVMEARKYYYPTAQPKHTDLTNWTAGNLPADIRKVLQSTAKDMHAAGADAQSGFGLLKAHSALLTLAAPNPEIIKLVIPEGVTPGEAEFTLTIEGINLYKESEVLFRGNVIESTFNEETENIEVVIPEFEGNPSIQIRNNAFSELGTDGGTTDPRYFFEIEKRQIFVRAKDATKKYGEVVPDFEATVYVLVDGIWTKGEEVISEEYPNGILLADVGLTNADQPVTDGAGRILIPVQLTSNITGSLSNVGRYLIIPSHGSTDVSFGELFVYTSELKDGIYTYNQNAALGLGAIEVQKLPLTIKANDLPVTYGESIADKITYQFNYVANIEDNASFQTSLQQLYTSGLITEGLAVVDQQQFNNG